MRLVEPNRTLSRGLRASALLPLLLTSAVALSAARFPAVSVQDDGVARGEFIEGEAVTGSLKYANTEWLYALFTVDSGNNFLQYVWEPEGGYADVWNYSAGDEFGGLEWVFNAYVGEGYVTIDRIDHYSFDEINITENSSDWSGVWYFAGIGGGDIRTTITQEADAVRGEIGIEWMEAFFVEGTAFMYHDPRGGSYDVLRGVYSMDNAGDYLGKARTITLDWRMGEDGTYICGRGHGGGSVQFLSRTKGSDWPECNDWYYAQPGDY